MSCKHKFYDELKLELIDYEPETLIVGTFEPGAPVVNAAAWFHGRTEDDRFWNVLPRLYGETSLNDATAEEWRQFCKNKKIAVTDIISSVDDAEADNAEHNKILGGFSDKAIMYNFEDLIYVDIVQILEQHPSTRNVYFTRGITEAYWRHLWNPVMEYSSRKGIHERRLISPSEDLSYELGAYNRQHPENQIAQVEDYILMRWREEWHF